MIFKDYTLWFLLFSFLIIVSASFPKSDENFALYVSSTGNDAWSGRLEAPNPRGTDGPFATIERARDEIRRLKKNHQLSRPVTVFVRGGTYYLERPIVFGPDDSGTPECPITYRAYADEHPVLSGGREIKGRQASGRGRWVANLPEVKRGSWYFRQLFVNDSRRFRARTPNKGFYRVQENPGLNEHARYNTPAHLFRYAPGDLDADWTNLPDVEVVVLHFWVDTHLPIKAIDPKSRIVTFRKSSRRKLTDDFSKQGARYYVDNVFEALDAPGEWYLNQKTGKLTYLPQKGENLASAQVIAPRLPQLLLFQGQPGSALVEYITISGLTFAHTDWSLPSNDAGDLQAANTVPGAIYATGARHLKIENCTLKHLGTYGVQLDDGCRYIEISRNRIYDLAAGGIRLSGGDADSDSTRRTGEVTIADNHLHHLGQIYHSADGILLQHADHNLITHNHIHHLYYTGISVGWVWGYRPSVSIGNRIEYNHIHDIGQHLLSDMGGIYLLGVSPGTVVKNNRIHDVFSWGYGGWGIYTDEGSSDILIEDNVVYRTRSAGFHQHYGENNIIRNNIFAFGQQAQIMRTRMEDHLSFTFERNVIYWKDADLLGSNWKDDQYRLDYNLYYRTDGRAIRFKDWTLEGWQSRGQDVHSVIADPGFVDLAHEDFALFPASPAFCLGFRQIDMTSVGPRTWPEEVREVSIISTADGSVQKALFYHSESQHPKPLLVALHTWSSNYKQKMSVPHANWCLQKDWIFIHPDFRGPNKRPQATCSDLVVQDILDAVDYAKTHAQVDTTRIYLVGVSGGGYASLMMAARAPELWAAISAWVPISDLRKWYYENVERKQRYAAHIIASCGGKPGDSPKVDREYTHRSPINFLERATGVPLDINAGIHDGHTGSVPISQSLLAFNRLAAPQDRIAEEDIDYFVKNERVPPTLVREYVDPFYGKRRVLFRRQSGEARVTIFEGTHEIIYNAALHWLEQHHK